MGTTLTALQDDGGVSIVWVAAIEGYDKLMTDTADTTAVETAWAGLEWSTAVSGLTVRGSFEQRMVPWNPGIEPNTLELIVADDYEFTGTATFGAAVHAAGAATAETVMTAAIDSDDATITVASTADFDATGTIYIGNERITYSGKGATTFTGCTRGTCHPFERDGGTAHQWGRYHDLPSLTFGLTAKPKVLDVRRYWVGAWVGLWAHRVVGGVLDTEAQAQLVFAGTIASISDTSIGETHLEIVEASEQIKRSTLLVDQFRGRVQEGIHLTTSWTISANERYVDNDSPPNLADNDADDLVVVASGASGDNEIDAGYYTLEEVIELINAWLNNEMSNGRLDAQWSIGLGSTDNGWRVRIAAQETSGTTFTFFGVQFYAPHALMHMFGFSAFTPNSQNQGRIEEIQVGTDEAIEFVGDMEPMRSMLGQYNDGAAFGRTCDLQSNEGTWFNNRDYLPEPWKSAFTESGENWGIVEIGSGNYALAKYVSDTELTLYWDPRLKDLFGDKATYQDYGIPLTSGGYGELKQLIVLYGDLRTIIYTLLVSTGTSNYNTAEDDFPWGLGVGLPHTICGADTATSLDNLAQATVANSTLIVLEKPTKLWDVLWSDIALRGAYLIWKNGSYRFVAPQMPSTSLSVHTLTEATKGSSIEGDNQRAVSRVTPAFVRNVLVLEYNREIVGGKYRDTVEIINAASVSDYGERRELRIKARNCYGAYASTTATVEAIAADLAARVMPLFGRPLRTVTRTVHMGYFESCTPGDIALVTDGHMRNPATGTRGVTAKPALVLGSRHAWGGSGEDMFGELDLLFLDVDRVTIYSPTADIASYAADTPGGGQSTITCTAHAHSESTEAVDASHFEAGDDVRIVQRDPASGSADTDTVSVVSVSTNDIVLDDNLGGLDFVNDIYSVVSQAYTDAEATQAADAYMADASDHMIEDVAPPYEYGDASCSAWTAAAATEIPSRYHTDMYGDGVPVAVGHARNIAVSLNNMISYKLAPQVPTSTGGSAASGSSGYWWTWFCFPVHAGAGFFPPGLARYWQVAPQYRHDGGGNETAVGVRVTFSKAPPRGPGLGSNTFHEPFTTLEWTTTNTTYDIGDVKTSPPIHDAATGVGFCTIELRGEDGGHGGVCEFRGLSIFHLGPLE